MKICLFLVVAFAAFERIDFFRGSGPFAFTPALLLFPFAIILLLLCPKPSRSKEVDRPAQTRKTKGGVLLWLYLSVAMASLILNGAETLSLRRYGLLCLLLLGGCATVFLAARMEGAERAIRRGAWLGLALALGMDLAQFWSWLTYGAGVPVWRGVLDLTSPTYGTFAPRPSGISTDPNRGAFDAAVFAYLILLDPWTGLPAGKSRSSIPAVVASGLVVAASFSRSGAVVWLVVILAFMFGKGASRSAKSLARTAFTFLIAAGSAWVAMELVLRVVGGASFNSLVAERLGAVSESSGGIHLELASYAYHLLGDRPSSLLYGIGFGNSPSVLGAFFGDDKYGNFHSLYLTSLVEMGIVGLLVTLGLVTMPLLSSRRVLALVIVGFDLFYQSNLEPLFWLLIALLWFAPSGAATEEQRGEKNVSPTLESLARGPTGTSSSCLRMPSRRRLAPAQPWDASKQSGV